MTTAACPCCACSSLYSANPVNNWPTRNTRNIATNASVSARSRIHVIAVTPPGDPRSSAREHALLPATVLRRALAASAGADQFLLVVRVRRISGALVDATFGQP